jgi:RNA polymerase sigma-70 factor (ECF subfamily)
MPVDPSHQVLDRWAEVVGKIRNGDDAAVVDLYAAVSDEARARLFRNIDPQSVEDRLHEILLIVLEAIRSGELRDPERLMGFVQTVTRRRVAAHIRGAILHRRWLVPVGVMDPAAPREESPEAGAAALERFEAIRKVLLRLRAPDREILTRFYLEEQPQLQICEEMRLTTTQFRLHKSRALARCLELANRRRNPINPPSRFLSRTA